MLYVSENFWGYLHSGPSGLGAKQKKTLFILAYWRRFFLPVYANQIAHCTWVRSVFDTFHSFSEKFCGEEKEEKPPGDGGGPTNCQQQWPSAQLSYGRRPAVVGRRGDGCCCCQQQRLSEQLIYGRRPAAVGWRGDSCYCCGHTKPKLVSTAEPPVSSTLQV